MLACVCVRAGVGLYVRSSCRCSTVPCGRQAATLAVCKDFNNENIFSQTQESGLFLTSNTSLCTHTHTQPDDLLYWTLWYSLSHPLSFSNHIYSIYIKKYIFIMLALSIKANSIGQKCDLYFILDTGHII